MTESDENDPRIRFRLYVAGELVDEVWFDVSNPDVDALADRARDRHTAMALEADAAGQLWMVEIYNPAASAESAYMRFGTDADGMIDPQFPPAGP